MSEKKWVVDLSAPPWARLIARPVVDEAVDELVLGLGGLLESQVVRLSHEALGLRSRQSVHGPALKEGEVSPIANKSVGMPSITC
jgi:hypothetical protein